MRWNAPLFPKSVIHWSAGLVSPARINYSPEMKKWLNSANHAASGLIFFIRTERNARIELSIALGVLLLGAWLGISILEMSIVLLCIGLVIAAEAFNTAIEHMADF